MRYYVVIVAVISQTKTNYSAGQLITFHKDSLELNFDVLLRIAAAHFIQMYVIWDRWVNARKT